MSGKILTGLVAISAIVLSTYVTTISFMDGDFIGGLSVLIGLLLASYFGGRWLLYEWEHFSSKRQPPMDANVLQEKKEAAH